MSSHRRHRRKRRGPQRNIVVETVVEDRRFRISCFHGKQTIKWLALAAAKQYQEQNHVSGRQRQRAVQAKHQGQLRPGVVYLVKRTKKK